ncbi:MAG: helix-turn-helix domain-containing protein [Saprospiraceae bacterium]
MEQITDYHTITLLNLVTIISFYECTFTGIHLLFKKSVRYQANSYLGGLLLVVVTFLLPGMLFLLGILEQFIHVVHIHFFTFLIFGPLAYFYIRACTQKDFKLKPKLWLHFIPALVGLLYFVPFYLQSGSEKFIAFVTWRETGSMGVPPWIMLIRLLHPIIYFIICIQLVLTYRKHLDNTTSYIDFIFHRWLLYFSVILLLPIFGAIVIVFSTNIVGYQLNVATAIFSLMLIFAISIRIAILVKPSLFHVFPHQMLIPNSTEQQKQRYEKSTLQGDKKDFYVKKLTLFMDVEKPFLASDLTLADLSKQIDIPSHHLSQTINEKLGCNFLDFINKYRVKEAQAMLVNPKLEHYTIVSIAYEAGFNSKSTFYTAFKKNTKMTPSQYKKQETRKVALME